MKKINLSLLVVLLVSIFMNKVMAQTCSVAVAGKALDIINWQGKIDLLKGNFSYSTQEDKFLKITGYVNNVYRTTYLPINKIENSLVADFNNAIVFNNDTINQYSIDILGLTANGILYGTSDYTGSSKIFLLKSDGQKQELGLIIAKDYLQDTRKFIYLDSNSALNIIDSKLGISTPFINQTLASNISKIKGTALFINNNRILYVTSSYVCSNCELSITIINLTNNKIVNTNGTYKVEEEAMVLSSGERIKFEGSVPNLANWTISTNSISILTNGQTIPVLATATFDSAAEFSFQSNDKNLLLIKARIGSQLYLIDSNKVKCGSVLPAVDFSDMSFIKAKIKGQPACDGKESTIEEWDQIVGKNYDQVISKNKLNFEDIDYLLQRYLRSTQLTDRDVHLIETIYQSSSANHFNDLLAILIDKYSVQGNMRQLNLIKRFQTKNLKLTGKLENVCMSTSVRDNISLAYKKLIIEQIKKLSLTQGDINFQKLLFVKNYLSILSTQDKEDIASDTGTLLAESVQRNDNNLRTVFFSTLDWFSTQKVREFLGLKPINLTDLVLTQNEGYISIIGTKELMSVGDFENSEFRRTKGGFYSLDPVYLNLYNEGSKKFSWYHGDEEFEGEVTKTKRKVDYVPAVVEAPDKIQLLDDSIYHGTVVIGSNIHGTTLENTKNSYLYYLKQQKFTISEPVEIVDALAFLKDGISGKKDKIDFFLKEAHSDGDYRNLFSINKKMFLVRAKFQHAEYLEVIDLMYHDGSYNAVYISNQEFGAWLKIRETEKLGGQFIYLNTSCSSYTKAAAELGTAAAKDLVVIPSSTSVYTFSTSQDNSTYYLFDGIRKMLAFSEIAKLIKGLKGTYIFPMEESYKSLVIKNINAGFETSSKVYKINVNGEREEYHIEQVLNAARAN
jgi:hypothetical protein